MDYFKKYLKYKNKYNDLKILIGNGYQGETKTNKSKKKSTNKGKKKSSNKRKKNKYIKINGVSDKVSIFKVDSHQISLSDARNKANQKNALGFYVNEQGYFFFKKDKNGKTIDSSKVTDLYEKLGNITSLKKLDSLEKYHTKINNCLTECCKKPICSKDPIRIQVLLKGLVTNGNILIGKPRLNFKGTLTVPKISRAFFIDYFLYVLNYKIPDVYNKDDTKYLDLNKLMNIFNKEFKLQIQEIKTKSTNQGETKSLKKPIEKQDILSLMTNDRFISNIFKWIQLNQLGHCFYDIYKIIWINAVTKDTGYKVSIPISTKELFQIWEIHNIYNNNLLYLLYYESVSFDVPNIPLRVHVGSMGELVLATLSQMDCNVRKTIQPLIFEKLKTMLNKLNISEEIKLSFDDALNIINKLGKDSVKSYNYEIQSTTNINDPFGSFIAQLIITLYYPDAIKQSYIGNLIKPFKFGDWHNSEDLKTWNAKYTALRSLHKFRSKKIIKEHVKRIDYDPKLLDLWKKSSGEDYIKTSKEYHSKKIKDLDEAFKIKIDAHLLLKPDIQDIPDLRGFIFSNDTDELFTPNTLRLSDIIMKAIMDTEVSASETKVSASETKVSANETKVSASETKVSAEETKVSANETKVSTD